MDFALQIGFLAAGMVSFTGKTAAEKDLGGSEYACVKMAEALASHGHDVTVYTPFSQEAYPEGHLEVKYNEVRYLASPDMWLPTMRFKNWDVFVVSRDYSMLTNSVINTKQLVLWNHDTLSDVDGFLEHIYPVDRIYCLSQWQKDHYLSKVNERGKGDSILEARHITRTRNGVDVEGIKHALVGPLLAAIGKGGDWRANAYGKGGDWWKEEQKYEHPTFLYASRPERGLLYLLRDIWPKILEKIPEARLHVAYYNVDQEKLPDVVKRIHHQCAVLMKQLPSVAYLGHMPRYSLYREMASCWAVLYPCVFPEINCLIASEAQACGTPILTSDYAALSETNLSPFHRIFDKDLLLSGDQAHIEKAASFIQSFVEHYHKNTMREQRKFRQEQVLNNNSWLQIAKEWEGDIYYHFDQRSIRKAGRIIDNLIYHSDLLAAQHAVRYIADIHRPGYVPSRILPEKLEVLDGQIDAYLEHHHDEPEQYGAFVDIGDAEDITQLPERMRVALDLIENRFGKDTSFTLLDLGCGSGRFLHHVMQRFPLAQVMGMDFSQKCLERADENLRRLIPGLSNCWNCGFTEEEHHGIPDGSTCNNFYLGILPFLVQGDFLECNPPVTFTGNDNEVYDERPDVCFCGEWLEHQVELQRALDHVNAWVKPGGLVIYTIPNGPWEALTFGEAFTKDGHEIRFHVSHFEERDILEMFADVQDLAYSYAYIQRSAIDNSPIGQFIVAYTAEEGVKLHTPNYTRKFLTTRPRPRIGATLITKDEEHNILRAIRQLKKRVDAIYIGDTGSQDRTVELASRDATVINVGWDEETGFAGARNTIRDIMCSAEDVDYILWLDADEELKEAHALRKYLTGDLEIFQAFVIMQYHFMLDSEMTRDVPMRIFRHNAAYQFHGLIHEQLMNLELDPDGNKVVFPSLIIEDVKIAHYGYVTDSDRRRKVVERNLPLLLKDRQVNPNRELGKLFIMRDFCNTVRWWLEKRPDQLSQYYVDMLIEVIQMYQEFKDSKHQNHPIAHIMYQDALKVLGNFRVAIRGQIPFQSGLVLMAQQGGLPDTGVVEPQKRWFLTQEEFTTYITEEASELTKRLATSNDIFQL